MSLVRVGGSVRPGKMGQPPSELAPPVQLIDDFWTLDFDTTFSARIPRGAIVFGFAANPAPYTSWAAGAANGLSQGSDTGMYFSVSSLPTWLGETIEVFMLWTHQSGTQSGDAVIRLDIGPRESLEAAGAPNDAASQRTTNTFVVAAGAGANQDVPRYDSLGTFTIGADDRVLIAQLFRMGADILDTFGAGIVVHGLHAVRV